MPTTHTDHQRLRLLSARAAAAVATVVLWAGAAGNASANINIVFDYTYDTNNFFDITKKNVLEAAAAAFEARLQDNLTAINSGAGGTFNVTFFNPSSPNNDITLNSFSVAANVVTIFAGASNLGGPLGVGGPGAFSVSGATQAFVDNALSRGQAGALLATETDFGPWGGAIGFNSASVWYDDPNPGTTEFFAGFDFYSVAVHEIGHVLGMGTAPSWDNRISGTIFNGPAVGSQAVNAGKDHWAPGALSSFGLAPQEAAMTPSISSGQRKYFTTLDDAGMTDIGWQVDAIPEPTTWLMWSTGAVLLAGLRKHRALRTSRLV